MPKEIVRGWGNVLWFNLEYFSLFVLLKTLFSPWRRQTVNPGRGFNPGKYFEALIGNLISRILGAIVRSTLFIAGLCAELTLVVLGPIAFFIWFALPVLFALSLVQGFKTLPSFQAYLLLALAVLGILWLVRSFSQSYGAAKPLPKTKSLAEFIKKTQKNLQFVFARLLLPAKEVVNALEAQPVFQGFESLLKDAKTAEDVLLAAFTQDPVFKKILIDFDITQKDLERVIIWFRFLKQTIEEQKKWWTKKNLRRKGTLGRQWTSGFSPLLDKFSLDVSQQVRKQGFFALVGHQKELQALERSLAKEQNNNALLVGEPGMGRWAIVSELAKRSLLGETLPELNHKRVVELDIPSLLSRVTGPGEREAVLDQIFLEVANAGNIILVIDEFHNFVNSESSSPGRIDITGILTKYLSSTAFPIVAITTFAGLHQNIEHNPSLLSLLDKVEVEEVTEEQALEVLQHSTPFFERKYRRFISFKALQSIVTLSQKYIQAVPLPKKALDLLDEAMVYLAQTKDKVLLVSHIAKVVEQKTQIPVGEVETAEKEILLNLEEYIHKKIINQEEAVKEVSSALRRARAEISQ
ncbi:MAG: AAA family ATPase, partial [bacterium]|nr:AAA family ATPase [bacterium]